MHWLLLIASAFLYAAPFLLSDYFWWLIFIFPVPLLYTTRTINISFFHGYVWGCVTFLLHLSGIMYVITCMAHEWWFVGVAMGIVVVLYQALFSAIFFWCATYIIGVFSISALPLRLLLYSGALWIFIIWVDWYSLWIFGVQEGYPLMHPLILLAQKPRLLFLLPIIGKQLLTIIFLLVPVSIVLLLWYKNYQTTLFFCSVVGVWLLCWLMGESDLQAVYWHTRIKSLPCMICATTKNPLVAVKIIGNQLKKIVREYPEADIIIMPESACNVSNFADLSEMIQLWDEHHTTKAIHFIFGASRWDDGNYYNSVHWIYNGILQHCGDKRHSMLMSERLPWWMNNDFLQNIYFTESKPVTASSDERKKFVMGNDAFVPYICSELFFNDKPDDEYEGVAIIVVVNDSLFLSNSYTLYIQKLLVLLARYKAIQWQRDIIYVSYAQSLLIDKHGYVKHINER